MDDVLWNQGIGVGGLLYWVLSSWAKRPGAAQDGDHGSEFSVERELEAAAGDACAESAFRGPRFFELPAGAG